MQEQLFEAAASEFEQALAANAAAPKAHFEFAVCLLSLGRNDEARRQFEQVQKLAGESRYVTYYLGRLDLLANDYASAIRRLGSLTEEPPFPDTRSEEHTSELQSRFDLVCRLLLEKKKNIISK